MFDIKCTKCVASLELDRNRSVETCLKDINYLKDDLIKIQDRWFSSKMTFECKACANVEKYTFEELCTKVKEDIARDVMTVRRTHMINSGQINPSSIKPDNGIEFCGICNGIDEKGNCYVDLIKQCTIRNTDGI